MDEVKEQDKNVSQQPAVDESKKPVIDEGKKPMEVNKPEQPVKEVDKV